MRTYVAKKIVVRKMNGVLWEVKGEGFTSFRKTYCALNSGLPLIEVQSKIEDGKTYYVIFLKDSEGNAHRKFVAEQIDIQI